MSGIFAEIKMVLTLPAAMWPDRSTTYSLNTYWNISRITSEHEQTVPTTESRR